MLSVDDDDVDEGGPSSELPIATASAWRSDILNVDTVRDDEDDDNDDTEEEKEEDCSSEEVPSGLMKKSTSTAPSSESMSSVM